VQQVVTANVCEQPHFTLPPGNRHDDVARAVNARLDNDPNKEDDEVLNLASTSSPKLLLTISKAANALSISRLKMYELLGSAAIRSLYIGRSRRKRVHDLEDFVRST
jgi:excisionase family DNA binding protein